MAVENQHATPSIDSATTNIAPSDNSTPAMSDQVNDDLEKGNRTAEPIDSDKHDVNIEPLSEKSEAVTPAPAGSPGPGPPPDGGLEAWMSVLGAFCGLFVSFGWINCMYNLYLFISNHANVVQASVSSKHTTRATNFAICLRAP